MSQNLWDAIWASDSNILLAQKKQFRASLWLSLISGTENTTKLSPLREATPFTRPLFHCRRGWPYNKGNTGHSNHVTELLSCGRNNYSKELYKPTITTEQEI